MCGKVFTLSKAGLSPRLGNLIRVSLSSAEFKDGGLSIGIADFTTGSKALQTLCNAAPI